MMTLDMNQIVFNYLDYLKSVKKNTIEEYYKEVLPQAESIKPQMPILARLATQAHRIVEFGSGFSTVAFAWGLSLKPISVAPLEMFCTDVIDMHWMDTIRPLVKFPIHFRKGSSLQQDPMECDLLFIDTLHVYEQLRDELKLHGHLAKVIALHDTETFGTSQSYFIQKYHPGDKGLKPAIQEFLEEHWEYELKFYDPTENGLTVLARRTL